MDQTKILDTPRVYPNLLQKCEDIGFSMPSDVYIGTLLKTMVASKPSGNFLELGTGIGLSLAWIIDGMDETSKLISVDNDLELVSIAKQYFNGDARVSLVCQDGSEWIKEYQGAAFDLVFADAWPGKYSEIDEILDLVKLGGFYVIDDMTAQPNWPDGHQENVDALVDYLEKREDFTLTKMDWSTGVLITVKTNTN